MEESFPRPWPNTTPLPQQQLPNSKCPNTSATNLQASEASNNTAPHGATRVSQACGCLNNDIRQTIPPRSNSPSLTHFRSSTQRRLLTLSRPWHIGRHLRRARKNSPSRSTCLSRRHIFCVPVLHILYSTNTYTAKLTSHSRLTEIVLRQIVPALLATDRSRRPTGTVMQRQDRPQAAAMQAHASTTVQCEQNSVRIGCHERQG